MLEKKLSREQLLDEIQKLRQEVEELKQEKADLELLLETSNQHSDTVQADLQQQALEAVQESERKLAQFLDAVPVGVCVLNPLGQVCYINQTAQQILGKRLVLGASFDQFTEVYQVYIAGTDQEYPLDRMPIVRALNGESVTIDDMEIHKQGEIFPLEVWATPVFNEKGEIIYAIAAFQDIRQRKQAEAERAKFVHQLFLMNQAYERFVPYQFLQFLNKDSIVEVQLGDQVQQEMSVLFADIRDFTALSESMTPEDNFKFINAYLSRMEPAIAENNGFIDKYIGDAIMALFSGSADDAVKAGISMLQRLSDYNQHRQRHHHVPIQIGIGINTGSLMLGTVGGHNRMDSTAISDTVNVAARIETLTKEYQVSLLISNYTFLQLQNSTEYDIRVIDKVKVKGKSETVSIFEVFDADPLEVREGKSVTKQAFEAALLLYYKHRYTEAAQLFADCLRQNPMDGVAQVYLERCQRIGG
jgi:adenylate cyclase